MSKKKKLNTDLDDAILKDDEVEKELVADEDQVDDDTLYTMGDILVDDGSIDEDDEDLKILSQASNSISSAGHDDEDDDIWAGDLNSVIDPSDDFLDLEDYDPEEDYYDG
ncbi:MAG: hypothetical protein Kow0081_1050 [Candidatus Dojkabacteria bacterium]